MEEDILSELRRLANDPNTTTEAVDQALRDAGLSDVANSLTDNNFAQRNASRRTERTDIFDRSRRRSERRFGNLGQSQLQGSVTADSSFGQSRLRGSVTRGFDRPRLAERLAPELQDRLAPRLPEILEPRLPDRAGNAFGTPGNAFGTQNRGTALSGARNAALTNRPFSSFARRQLGITDENEDEFRSLLSRRRS